MDILNFDDFPVRKLSPKKFRSAIHKGQGRAFLHIKRYGLDSVADIVFESCLHNQVFDGQIDSCRSSWLYEMIKESSIEKDVRKMIIERIQSPDDVYDYEQYCGLLRIFAENGDDEAKRILFEIVLHNVETSTWFDKTGINDYLKYFGDDGIVHLGNACGKRLISLPEDGLSYPFTVRSDYSHIKEVLVEHAQEGPFIQTFLEYLADEESSDRYWAEVRKQDDKADHQAKFRAEISIDMILDDHYDLQPMDYSLFGRYATDNELNQLFQQLLHEKHEKRIIRLLRVFEDRAIPRFDDRLLELANNDDDIIRQAAISALSNVTDPKIHDYARKSLSGSRWAEVFDPSLLLFMSNYKSEDAGLIAGALSRIRPGSIGIHYISLNIFPLVEKHRDPALFQAMNWIYERSSCSACRREVLVLLHDMGLLSEKRIFESCYDAEKSVREYSRSLSDKK